jgi:hypothetical protein
MYAIREFSFALTTRILPLTLGIRVRMREEALGKGCFQEHRSSNPVKEGYALQEDAPQAWHK